MLRDETYVALDTRTLYALLKLRADVFVVEQACAYPDLDDLDHEPGTRHVWWDEGSGPLAYLRVLAQEDGSRRIGRVVTATTARRRGLAERLIRHVIDDDTAIGVPVVLDAQAHLEEWYRRLGFETTGPVFIEDGIAHVPMQLTSR